MKPLPGLVLLFCVGAFLKTNAQLSIFAGPQATTAQYSIRGVDQATEAKIGFQAGIRITTLIEGPVYFSPSLSFNRKGYKVSFDRPAFPPDSGAVNNATTINAIELAPLIQINFSKKASYLFLRLGPSFDFNLSGREEFDSTNGKRINRNMRFDYAVYSHGTIAVNVQSGFQHKSGFSCYVYLTQGISSLNNADNGPKIFHQLGGIAVSWQLGKKK